MTPAALLAELRRLGVTLVADGEGLRYRPRDAVPAELVSELRQHKPALLRLLPHYAGIHGHLTAPFGTTEDLTAFEWYASLSGDGIIDEIAALERRCEDLARDGADEGVYRAAVTALVERIRQIRDWYREAQRTDEPVPAPHPPPAWRLVVESCEPVAGPVTFNRAETVPDPATYIARTLAALELAVEARNAGRERSALVTQIDELIGRLALCGAVVRVQVIA